MVILRNLLKTVLGFASINWVPIAGAAVAFGAIWYGVHSIKSLSAENATLRAAVATYEAAARAQAIVNDLEEKAAVDAAEAEKNNVRVLDGWHGVIIAAPDVANCVSGDTLMRLRGLN